MDCSLFNNEMIIIILCKEDASMQLSIVRYSLLIHVGTTLLAVGLPNGPLLIMPVMRSLL
jgi:hypothetical protein